MPTIGATVTAAGMGSIASFGHDHSVWLVGGALALLGGVGWLVNTLRKQPKALSAKEVESQRFFQELARLVGRQAVRTAEISRFIDVLRNSIAGQFTQSEHISAIAEELAATVRAIAENSAAAGRAADETAAQSEGGLVSVNSLVEEAKVGSQTVVQVSVAMQQLQEESHNIQGIAQVIRGIADQTNLLALNAAIEAARAGEYGRGFTVVASEVRGLANQTARATTEIEQMLARNHAQAEQVVTMTSSLQESMGRIAHKVNDTGAVLNEIAERARQSNEQSRLIAGAMQEHVKASQELSSAIVTIRTHLDRSHKDSNGASEDGIQLAELAENILSCLSAYTMGPRHDLVRDIATATALEIGRLFEGAIDSGRITHDALFDRHYRPIENTSPQKYHTKFDGFTDAVLPPIQERVLAQHSFILFAGAVDNNGYFPTHNKRYSKPLTGDHQVDLVNNRTKRIFDDRTGSRCGRNTRPFLLQTYKRDTGEVIHDLSAPILVKGRHWGGFRIGYMAEKE